MSPHLPQLSERMDLLLECLERLQSRLQSQPSVRGDAAHLREQIRENSLALGELEKLGAALESVRAQGGELLASMQAANSDAAARGTGAEGRTRSPSHPPQRVPGHRGGAVSLFGAAAGCRVPKAEPRLPRAPQASRSGRGSCCRGGARCGSGAGSGSGGCGSCWLWPTASGTASRRRR